jgi:hypothetical protein
MIGLASMTGSERIPLRPDHVLCRRSASLLRPGATGLDQMAAPGEANDHDNDDEEGGEVLCR